LIFDAAKSCVELLLTDEEGVVLGGDVVSSLGEVQADAVVGLGHEEMPEPAGRWQTEDRGQERRRPLLVTARDDGVVQLHAHVLIVPMRQASEQSRGRHAPLAGGWNCFVMSFILRLPCGS
jgi:hypothetical protein